MSGEKDIKQEAIEHYNRMIAFAAECKENNVEFSSDRIDFFSNSIGECWQGEFCSYCIKYYFIKPEAPCGKCPLNPHESKDAIHCCDGVWNRINMANSWDTLVKALTDVKKYIEGWG